MMNKNLKRILSDEKFLTKISNIKSTKELKSKFNAAGLDVSLEFAEKFFNMKNEVIEKNLSDDDLDSVVGGLKISSKAKACFLAFSMLLPTVGNDVQAGLFPFGGSKSEVLTQYERNQAIQCTRVSTNSVFPGINTIMEQLRNQNPTLYNTIRFPDHIDLYEINTSYVNTLPLDKRHAVNEELAAINETQTRAFLAQYDDRTISALIANPDTRELGTFLMGAKGTAIVTDSAQQAVMKILQSILPILGTIVGIKFGGDIIDHLSNFYVSGKNHIKNLHYKFTHKQININAYKSTVDRIEKRLHEELVGQDEAISSIVRLLTGYFESVLEAKSLNKKFEGGLILYLTGAPGTGKSTTMKIIQEEMKLGSCVCRMSDAVEDKGNNAQTVAARLTKPIIIDTGKTKATEDTLLTRQLNTGFSTLFCFDEVDKMRILDSTLQKRNYRNEKGEIIGGSIDEMLRNFGDTGTINGKNTSGSIVVATSNETIDDLKNLESSLYNRYKNCNVSYKEFNSEDYKEIINRKFIDVQESCKKRYNTVLSLHESIFNHYCQKFEEEKSGGRGAEILMNDIRYSLSKFKEQSQSEFENLNLVAKFDERLNNIIFEKM